MAPALFVLTGALLVLIYTRSHRLEKRIRESYFSAALPLFQKYQLIYDGNAWPVLTGQYGGMKVLLQPVADDLAWRKIPSLWLKVTVLSTNLTRGTLSFLVRPRGDDFHLSIPDLIHQLPSPEGWPSDAVLYTDDVSGVPDLRTLPAAKGIFQDERFKQLIITPSGVRLVYQAAQAERSDYLLTRLTRFSHKRGDPALIRRLLDAAVEIADLADGPPLINLLPAEPYETSF